MFALSTEVQGIAFAIAVAGAALPGTLLAAILAVRVQKRPGHIVRVWLYFSIALILLSILIIATRWSFRGLVADAIMLSAGYAAVFFLVVLGFCLSKSRWTSIPIGVAVVLWSMLNLVLGTFGALTSLFFLGDIPVTAEFSAGPGYVCRQQRFGNAISRDGMRVTILKTPWYFPGIEKRVYEWLYYDGANPSVVTEAIVDNSISGRRTIRFKTGDGKEMVDTF